MMNFKQREVLENIVAGLREKFPEVRLVGVEELSPFEFWVMLTEPADEERQLAMERLQGELGTDALLDYGVDFHFMPAASESRQSDPMQAGEFVPGRKQDYAEARCKVKSEVSGYPDILPA